MSIHSPKAKYRIEINFKKAVKGIGSVASFSSDDKDELLKWASNQVKVVKTSAQATLFENLKKYPQFEWARVCKVNYDVNG